MTAKAGDVSNAQQMIINMFSGPAGTKQNVQNMYKWLDDIAPIMQAEVEKFGLQEKLDKLYKEEAAKFDKELKHRKEQPSDQMKQQEFGARMEPITKPVYDEFNAIEVDIPELVLEHDSHWSLQTAIAFLSFSFVNVT